MYVLTKSEKKTIWTNKAAEKKILYNKIKRKAYGVKKRMANTAVFEAYKIIFKVELLNGVS